MLKIVKLALIRLILKYKKNNQPKIKKNVLYESEFNSESEKGNFWYNIKSKSDQNCLFVDLTFNTKFFLSKSYFFHTIRFLKQFYFYFSRPKLFDWYYFLKLAETAIIYLITSEYSPIFLYNSLGLKWILISLLESGFNKKC